jgi:hypothetical protein
MISCPTANGMAASKAEPIAMESPSSTNLDTASFIEKTLWVKRALAKSRKNGMMEHWNAELKKRIFVLALFALFQFSNIPPNHPFEF